ncbi:MAG TPA: alpha-2-macroglobulin family protein [Blastocatellia bacterium]|nr:alpha-2-macroglobulin family protein [Blastocatellia bacterium]
MRSLAALFLSIALCLAVTHADQSTQQTDYAALKAEGERLYSEGTYSRAREVYVKARELRLTAVESRWVDFRLADTLWRAQAGTQTADSTKFEEARQKLEALVRDISREEDRDLVWAEVEESLGDFWWTRNDSKNWHQGWQFYQRALDWWAGSPDIPTARDRYLKIVWKISKPAWSEPYYYYGYYGNYIPFEVLENALKIAESSIDRAHLHYLIAMTLRGQGGEWDRRQRVPEEFEAALTTGRQTDWYDDALYYYAEWMMNTGRIIQTDGGGWQQEPDYAKALELFRRFISEHQKGESRYYDQVKGQIENITRPTVGVGVSNVFLPDSEIGFHLNWRNVRRVDLAIYKVDLTRDIRFTRDDGAGSWIQRINTGGRERVRAWSKQTDDKGDYKPSQAQMRVDGKLAAGAYLIEAAGNGARSRDLILVTDASIVLKTSGRQALAYVCNAESGAPLAEANVTLWERGYDGNQYSWREQTKSSGSDGIAVFDLAHNAGRDEVFVAAASGDRQAFASGYSHWSRANDEPWRIYAFTDRPAYRPGDTAQWKFIARTYADGAYVTPANEAVEFEIVDPRGSKIKEGSAELNAFGTAWGAVELTEAMPLGEYRVNFFTPRRQTTIGNAVLFRLEEYKLPEFKVSVQTPEENGKKKAFRLGEKVEINVEADYYFGGPVSNATVEVLVYQNPFYHYWHQPREYQWYYEDIEPQRYYYGRGQGSIVKRETLKTDADGKAKLVFETPRGAGQDWEYRIEARVTDASRREVVGTSAVRVTRQRYYVYPRAKHYLYRPQDKVTIDIKSLDANEQPVSVEGRVKVTRDYWYEVWLDPNGREVKGEELKRLRGRGAFPPSVSAGSKRWQLKFQGYEHDDILTETVRTDAQGEAEFSFTPLREGYYRVAWTSDDKGGPQIKAETSVWVATTASTDLGYRHGGLEIIVDRDTFRAGQKAPVMLVAPTNDRWILFSVEGEDLYSYQLVHLTGTVKLIDLAVEDKHVPNVFLSAAMISDRQIFADTKQVIVPPADHFLSVEVKPDRAEYQPRDEGTLSVTTLDADGRPVAAEVALGLVDESVFYIQQDYAGDPRKFYFGSKRYQHVQTTSTFQQKSYTRLVEGVDRQLMDDRLVGQKDAREFDQLKPGEGIGAGRGGGVGGVASGDVLIEKSESVIGRRVENLARLSPSAARSDAAQPEPPPPGQEPAVQVRSDFRATALWEPGVVTDKDGKATVKVKFPDSLTGWTASARVVTAGSQFGIASATARTKQPLIVRLQAPRFFVVGDSVTVSAVINNNTDDAMTVAPSLIAEGVTVAKGEQGPVSVAPNSEKRVDWLVAVTRPGSAKLKVEGRATKYADAMEKSFVVHEHGIEKLVTKSGKLRGNDVTIKLDIPAERNRESTTLTVQVAPSIATTCLDALPYLIDYPYGCTEQTMSRFLPAIITRKTLKDLGLKPESVMGRIFGGIERETGSQTHPRGEKDLRKLDEMVKQGLERLYGFQHSDGGWGWWKDGESDHFMTAYVVWGLTLARDAGVDVKSEALKRGADFLAKEIVEEELNYDMQAWMLHALAVHHESSRSGDVGRFEKKALENLWGNRDRLNAYTRALVALAAHHYGDAQKAKTLVENLENGVKLDSTPDVSIIQQGPQSSHESVIGTAHWGEDGLYWRWSDGGVEATAFALRALLAIDPANKLVEPVTNWLIKNRRGAQWSNTRDTAITVLTMNEYLRRSGELQSEIEYELSVNGQPVAARKLTREDALSAPSLFNIEPRFIRDGANSIRIVRKGGASPIYFSAGARFFSLEEPVTATGNEIFARREYYKLVGRPTLLKGYVYERVPLRDGEMVTSGDRVEAVITVEAKNNYEYLVFEDLKPAGLEAVQVRSGEPLFARQLKSGAVDRRFATPSSSAASQATTGGDRTALLAARVRPVGAGLDGGDYTGRTRWVYQELRDRKVAMFIDKLPEGVWEMRYDLRAEVPGVFHALPVVGHAMYVPEIRCNGVEARIRVEDKK